MESTVAFSVLMELISVLGIFLTTPMFFGLSVINILVISFIFSYVIGICLGGVSPRLNFTREKSVGQVREVSPRDGAKETYIGGGKY